MPDALKPEEIEAVSVAYLAATGRTQVEIARILNISQSAVSRLFKTVKDTYVRTTFCEDKVTQEDLQEIQRRTKQRALDEKLEAFAGEHGEKGPVVHSVFIHEGADRATCFEEFAKGAARVVESLLRQVQRNVGVAWGGTLWQTTLHLREVIENPWPSSDRIDFIPLCGEPLVDTEHAQAYADRTSSRIASELSRIVNGEEPRPVWLGAVPAFIPRAFKKGERKVIDRLIELVPHYIRIFGPRDQSKPRGRPVAEDLDMILTSAGDSEHPVGFGKGPLLQLSSEEMRDLAARIYGDIGGVLIAKPEISKRSASSKNLVAELTDLWTGLKLEHLRNCADVAFSEHPNHHRRPGVTLLVFREGLADLVLEAVRQGLINHLIIGSGLEAEVEAKLDSRLGTQSRVAA